MYVLAIESAGSEGGIGLLGEGVAFETVVPLGPGRGELLPQLVGELLQLAKVGWDSIGLLAVDVGPGSFTGLRMGLSLAKALAQVHGLPVAPVRQTEAVGWPLAQFWPGRVCVWIYDRRDYLYMAWVERERVGQEKVLSFSEAVAKVRARSPLLLAGSGALRFSAEIPAQAPGVVLAPPHLCFPRPLVVAQLGLARYNREGSVDVLALEPHYVHKEGEDV
ncbi:MAG: tRNA (adenosine(37)-N6)-threonylcarbamoyltransferase complex dimerization subunit type 1 TsaB [Candidatus Bipolaricaulaceae bacterium]